MRAVGIGQTSGVMASGTLTTKKGQVARTTFAHLSEMLSTKP